MSAENAVIFAALGVWVAFICFRSLARLHEQAFHKH
jgi:hypothetical protein